METKKSHQKMKTFECSMLSLFIIVPLLPLCLFSKIVLSDKDPPKVKGKFSISYPILEHIDMNQIDKETFSFSGTDYEERWESYYFLRLNNNIFQVKTNDSRAIRYHPVEWLRSETSTRWQNFRMFISDDNDKDFSSCLIGTISQSISSYKYFKITKSECDSLNVFKEVPRLPKGKTWDSFKGDGIFYFSKTKYLIFSGINRFIPMSNWDPNRSFSHAKSQSEDGKYQRLFIYRAVVNKTAVGSQGVYVTYRTKSETDPNSVGSEFQYEKLKILDHDTGTVKTLNCFFESNTSPRIYCFVGYHDRSQYRVTLRRQKIKKGKGKNGNEVIEPLPEFEEYFTFPPDKLQEGYFKIFRDETSTTTHGIHTLTFIDVVKNKFQICKIGDKALDIDVGKWFEGCTVMDIELNVSYDSENYVEDIILSDFYLFFKVRSIQNKILDQSKDALMKVLGVPFPEFYEETQKNIKYSLIQTACGKKLCADWGYENFFFENFLPTIAIRRNHQFVLIETNQHPKSRVSNFRKQKKLIFKDKSSSDPVEKLLNFEFVDFYTKSNFQLSGKKEERRPFQLYTNTKDSMSFNACPFTCEGDYFRKVICQSDHFQVYLRPYYYLYKPHN